MSGPSGLSGQSRTLNIQWRLLIAGSLVVLASGVALGVAFSTWRAAPAGVANTSAALWTLGLVGLLISAMKSSVMGPGGNAEWGETVTMWTLLIVLWWTVASGFDLERGAVLGGAGFVAGVAGMALGFLTTAFGSENASLIGKARDWVVGGLAGVTLTAVLSNASSMKAAFAALCQANQPILPAIQAGNMALLGFLGFFAMFTLRELYLNPSLADARRKLADVKEELSKVPIEPASDLQVATERPLKISAKPEERRAALATVQRVEASGLNKDSLDPESQLRLAKVLMTAGNYVAAADTLDRTLSGTLEEAISAAHNPSAALRLYSELASADKDGSMGLHRRAADQFIRFSRSVGPAAEHFAGYHLLWVPDRIRESLDRSQRYLKNEPDSPGTLFNVACALGQLLSRGEITSEAAAERLLPALESAVRLDSTLARLAEELSATADGDLYAVARDPLLAERFRKCIEDGKRGAAPAR